MKWIPWLLVPITFVILLVSAFYDEYKKTRKKVSDLKNEVSDLQGQIWKLKKQRTQNAGLEKPKM